MVRTPSIAEKELDQAQAQFDQFDQSVKSMTLDRMNEAPKTENEQQTQLSQKEINKTDQYLKPTKSIGTKDKFNENFRDKWNFAKEYVKFIAENNEIIGENIEMWTRPFGGVPAEFWTVPTNKPVWGPRYLAEQINKCRYHRLVMQENHTNSQGGNFQFYGSMAADTTVNRLEARPATSQKSIFTGAVAF